MHPPVAQISWEVKGISITNLSYKLPLRIIACVNEYWSVQVLRDRLNSLLFELMAIALQVVAQLLWGTIAFSFKLLANLPQVEAKRAFQPFLQSVKVIEAEVGGYDG